MLKKTIITAALGVVLTAGAASAGTVWIDTFADPSGGLPQRSDTAVSDPNTTVETGLGAGTIGGSRSMEIASTGMPPMGLFASSTAGNDLFTYDNDAGVTSVATLLYDADGAGLGGVDLIDGLNDVIKLEGVESDASIMVKLSITDTLGGMSMSSLITPEGMSDILFNIAGLMGDADLTTVDSIALTLTALEGSADLSATSFSAMTTVPLPASALLLLGAVGGLGFMRRKS